MVQSVAGVQGASVVSSLRESIVAAYRWMLLARVLDEKFASLYRAGKIHGEFTWGAGRKR